MLLDHLPSITPVTCESPRPRRRSSVFDHAGEFRRSISSKSRAQIMEHALERSTKALGQRDGVLGPSTPMVRRGRYRAISSTSQAAASATSSEHKRIVLKYFKSGSTDYRNLGTLVRCGTESLRITTNLGSYEAQK